MTNFHTSFTSFKVVRFTSFKIVRKSWKMSSVGHVVYMSRSVCNIGRSNFKGVGFDGKVSL
jgi:hypothetical protein